ncbi:1360_t:CDS:2 [Funneliformis geosporum]|uniref:1360_t:CDS:1 n=1 Tax=Funneliformis geosporum TaxID=1117311 RepID=A0A9W4SL97_9GLOM|nr:1360_t:CDS:2 [Funneliformis geosporum]
MTLNTLSEMFINFRNSTITRLSHLPHLSHLFHLPHLPELPHFSITKETQSLIAFVLLCAMIAFIVAFTLDLILSSLINISCRKNKYVLLPAKISASISTKKLSSCQGPKPSQKPENLESWFLKLECLQCRERFERWNRKFVENNYSVVDVIIKGKEGEKKEGNEVEKKTGKDFNLLWVKKVDVDILEIKEAENQYCEREKMKEWMRDRMEDNEWLRKWMDDVVV